MITDDLDRIAQQERELIFPRFDYQIAWQLGVILREFSVARHHGVVIDVRRFGQQLFFTALADTTPDNMEWVRRKTNTVARFLRSSYAVGRKLELQQTTLTEKYDIPAADYVAHGGSFPITVEGAGVVGVATVSGLVQRADHELVVEAICALLGKSYDQYKLEGSD